MDVLVNAVAGFLTEVTKLLPNWSLVHDISTDVQTITPYIQKANVLVPLDTAMTIFGLWIGLQLMLIALYWLTRVINLIRGAG